MTSKPENPQAFPLANDGWWRDGMTLRDYFAGKALIGLLASPCEPPRYDSIEELADHIARVSCLYADAMLRAREGK